MIAVIDGIKYHVDICGDGFPLLLLHGFTGDCSTWLPFCDEWGKHSTLYSFDIIGHGETDAPKDVKKYDILTVADTLYQFLEKNKLEKVDVIGYSMGGRLALTFATKYPQKVRKLILESATPGLQTEEERQQRRKQDLDLASFIRNKGIEAFVEYWGNIPLFESQKMLSKNLRQDMKKQRLKNSVIGLSNSLLGMGTGSQPSRWNELEKLECDTLLITGSLDQKFCQIAENMMKKLKKGQWTKVDNCGHAIHVENRQKFGTIVSEFLSK